MSPESIRPRHSTNRAADFQRKCQEPDLRGGWCVGHESTAWQASTLLPNIPVHLPSNGSRALEQRFRCNNLVPTAEANFHWVLAVLAQLTLVSITQRGRLRHNPQTKLRSPHPHMRLRTFAVPWMLRKRCNRCNQGKSVITAAASF